MSVYERHDESVDTSNGAVAESSKVTRTDRNTQ